MENKRIHYAAIIVVYNKQIRDSITCEKIKHIPNLDIEVIIVDNSEKDLGNGLVCASHGYKYLSMHGNKGLSKAYNTAIDNTNADMLIFFDDDTEINSNYFETLNDAVVNNENVDIFAPIIYGQDGVIYSPNEFHFLRNHFITSPDQNVSQERFNAIASCLAVRKRIFDGYRFNERLFVDQIDQYFFCEQRRLGRKFMKINAVVRQNFYQRGEVLTANNGWRRVRLRMIDVMRHARLMGETKYKLLGFIKCCGLSMQIARKCKSVNVLIWGLLLSCKLVFVIPENN